jgi:DNA-binding Xre family transcriptional regulator
MSRPINPASIRQRAKALGIDESTLRKREKRTKPPPVERCETLDTVCEVPNE